MAGMTSNGTSPKRWQLGISDLFIFVTGVSLSFGLFSLAFKERFESDAPAGSFFFMEGVIVLFGSFGTLLGRLYWGTKSGALRGFILGGFAGIILIFVLLMPAVH